MMRRSVCVLLLVALWVAIGSSAQALGPGEPKPKVNNHRISTLVTVDRQVISERHQQRRSGQTNGKSALGVGATASTVQWESKSRICTGGGLDPMCSGVIIDCRASGGGTPRLVWQRPVGTTEWIGPQQTCLPGTPPPPDINDPTLPRTPPPPPVPTITQIREAFLELPFAKPTVSTNPGEVDGKTLKDFKTYYAASWPDEGLAPGDVSKPVKLLSWTIEFKIASKDYRYDFGDGHTSGWTSSTGGVYPDGDVTHSYQEVGTKDIKVDARLVGQYRVNGGAWQDLGAVADLQDEPVADIQVVGTRTRLQAY